MYRKYLRLIGADVRGIDDIRKIPFIPVGFFKDHAIVSGDFNPMKIFESSGTTGSIPSRHYVEDLQFYNRVTEAAFNQFYGPLNDYNIIGLLPSYLERDNASLVYMVRHFINKSGSPYSGFFLRDYDRLLSVLKSAAKGQRKTLIIGVTFALMELAELQSLEMGNNIVMETGGMKGNRPEITREEVHFFLKERFSLEKIHSEYGMTELFSQAYSAENGWFYTPPWMKVLVRDTNDPFEYVGMGDNGGINIIDLANIFSCAFIETSDLGVINSSGGFRILGRMDNSDVRGCNLMLHF